MSIKIDTINISDNKVTKKQYKFDPIDEINLGLLHQVVKASRTNFRNNTASVKTRAQVSGTGAKPWAQKGTGRARQGSLRSPQFIGGGIAHGPGTRVYRDRTPKKMKKKQCSKVPEGGHFLFDHILSCVGWAPRTHFHRISSVLVLQNAKVFSADTHQGGRSWFAGKVGSGHLLCMCAAACGG